MKDFTKKGTKLPVIPKGIEYSTTFGCSSKYKFDKNNPKSQRYKLYSIGLYDNEYLICDEKKYLESNSNHFLIKLSTIERLAKEQGMLDDDKEFTIKPPYNAITVTLPCGHDTEVEIGQTIKYEDCEQCKTNQMNQKVTLQENGTITVTDTETTTTLSKTTVDEICRLVKEDGEKVKLEVGKWYHYIGGLYVWNNGNTTYGFNSQKRFYEHYSFSTSNGAVEATTETVQQYLIEEAVKRGYRKGTAIRYVPHAIDYVEGNYFEVEDGQLKAYAKPKHERKCFDDYKHDTLFDGKKWVEIVDPSKRSDEQKAIDDMHNIY